MKKRKNIAALTAAAAAVVGVVGLAGCGTERADGTGGPAAATTRSGDPSVSPLPTPSKAVASKNVSIGGQQVPLEVYSIKRTETLVTLEFGLKNTSKDSVLTGGDWLQGSPFSRTGEDDVSGVYLVDSKNKKKYEPAVFKGNCLCSQDLDQVMAGPGQTIYLTASYGAPPSDITTLDVNFPKYGTFAKVPVG